MKRVLSIIILLLLFLSNVPNAGAQATNINSGLISVTTDSSVIGPSTPSVNVSYTVNFAQDIGLDISYYDSNGKCVYSVTWARQYGDYFNKGTRIDTWSGTDYESNRLPNGKYTVKVTASGYAPIKKWGSGGSGPGQFKAPYAIAVSPDNSNIYVADSQNNRVQRFDNNGNVLSFNVNGLANPQGIAVDSSGNVYISDTYNKRILEYSYDGSTLIKEFKMTPDPDSGAPLVFGIDVGGSKICFSLLGISHIVILNSQWTFVNDLDNGDGINMARGVAVDDQGNIYVANTESNEARKFSASGSYLGQWGDFNRPHGIDADSGFVYVADTWHHNVKKYDSNGNLKAIIGDPPLSTSTAGTGDGQLNIPTDVAAVGDYLYVLEYGTPRVQVFQNIISTKMADIIVDYGAPVTTLAVTDNTASLSASDNQDGSGVKSTEYSLDGKTWIPYSAPFTVASGATIYYRSTDNAGNIETPKSQSITSDTVIDNPPVINNPTPTPTVTVSPDMKSLEVQIKNPSTVVQGENATVTVEVWGKTGSNRVRVEGASVIMTAPQGTTLTPISGTTDANGACTFTFNAPNTGNYMLSAVATKDGYPEGSNENSVAVNPNYCPMSILPYAFIIALIVLLLAAALFLLMRMTRVKLEPRKTLILADGNSTALVIVSLENWLGRPAKAKKDVYVTMGTTAGTIGDAKVQAGSSSAEATLTSSREFGPVVITANYGNKTARAGVDFKYDSASLDVSAAPPEIMADGKSTSTVTIRIKDGSGEYIAPLKEQVVELHATLGRIQSPVKIAPKVQSAAAILTAGETSGEAVITALMGSVKGETKVTLKGAARRFCMHCGSSMTMDASKCPRCGLTPPSGVDVKHCTTCKAVIPEAAKYCDKCGAQQPEKAV
jgi:ribosomal protein L40E